MISSFPPGVTLPEAVIPAPLHWAAAEEMAACPPLRENERDGDVRISFPAVKRVLQTFPEISGKSGDPFRTRSAFTEPERPVRVKSLTRETAF